MGDALIEMNNVTIIRDDITVLEDVSWRVERGENWFIMGNNGSGKTSLLETVMAYIWPRKGTVTVLGEEYGHTFIPDVRKRIGYVSPWVFERIHGAVPVKDVVVSGKDASVGYRKNMTGQELEDASLALEIFDAAHLLERRFGELSSGEQFRVVMARAMVNSPELLLLDEPFAQLDMGTRLHLYDRLEHITGTGTSVILVTHHIEDIRPVFSHGLLLKGRRVLASGNKEEMLAASMLSGLFDIPPDRF